MAVCEWWRGPSGAPARKLRYFAEHQHEFAAVAAAKDAAKGASSKGGKKGKRENGTDSTAAVDYRQHLLVWAFEDWLKRFFFDVLRAIERLSNDTVVHSRTQAVGVLSSLLQDKPEQESNILRLLVNKLGDNERAVASKASHLLLDTLQLHPGMSPIVIREISAIVLQPSTAAASSSSGGTKHMRFEGDKKRDRKSAPKSASPPKEHSHAKYYGIITLNQIVLDRKRPEVADKLMDLYLQVFGDVLGDADEETVHEGENKMTAAILTGINRAFPYTSTRKEGLDAHLDALFRVVHTSSFNVSIQALQLVFKMASAQPRFLDRFYRALYSTLYDARLMNNSKHALYLNLLYRALKHDPSATRTRAFVKRLLQVVLVADTMFALGSLWIVGELFSSVAGLRDAVSKTAAAPEEGQEYDGKKREPLHAGAEYTALWELNMLARHHHPSIASHASALLAGGPVSINTDLERHTLSHLLDRFAYRDARQQAPTRGTSMMQPGLASQDQSDRLVFKKGAHVAEPEVAVNSDAFRSKRVDQLAPDQIFFHRFFASMPARAKQLRTRFEDIDGDDSDAEDAIWDAMQRSLPMENADVDDDVDDDDLDDLDDLEDDDESVLGDGEEEQAESDGGESAPDVDESGEAASEDDEVEQDFDDEDEDDDGLHVIEEDSDLVSEASFSLFPPEKEEEDEAEEQGGKQRKRRKLDSLPMFGSAEDYAHLIDQD